MVGRHLVLKGVASKAIHVELPPWPAVNNDHPLCLRVQRQAMAPHGKPRPEALPRGEVNTAQKVVALGVIQRSHNPTRQVHGGRCRGLRVMAGSAATHRRAAPGQTHQSPLQDMPPGATHLSGIKQFPDQRGGANGLTYRLKKPGRNGNTVAVLSPVELLMRLSSLIPAPGHPARKCFGILAARGRGPEAGGFRGHAPQTRPRAPGRRDAHGEPAEVG